MDDSLYQQTILQLASEGARPTTLEAPDGSARIDNPLCGDRVDAQVRLEAGKIAEVGFKVRGCRLCEASAAMVARAAPGLSQPDWDALSAAFDAMIRNGSPAPEGLPEATAFEPVRDYKSRHDCPLLPLQAVSAALKDAETPA